VTELVLRFPGAPVASRVRFDPGGLARLGRFVQETTGSRRALLVSDTHVAPFYAAGALASLRRAGIRAHLVVVPAGEKSKRPEILERLWRQCASADLERGDAIVALGGGVVGDLAGFAAATWQRGVPWVGVPTTVLAQVDSSVGGKTAVDLAAGKNLVGAFHQPAGVLVDARTLATLPRRHTRAGLAEVVKMGMACDAGLFRWCERSLGALERAEIAALEEAVERGVRVKARVVTRDERERGARTALNFGHTVAHALEAALGYRGLLHGEAVALGMRVAARLSARLARLDAREVARLERALDALGLPRRMPPVSVARLEAAMRSDKKRRGGDVRWVLTPRMGFASVPRSIAARSVRAALLEAGARG
jgi:3-dehydroquinate synthase